MKAEKFFTIYSHGKSLLTGEYLVLKGAKALGLPLKKGQKTCIKKTENYQISWKSYYNNQTWFQAIFQLSDIRILQSNDLIRAKYIQNLLLKLKELSSEPHLFDKGLEIECKLEFNPEWGLGSSSTLIYNLAQWVSIDPYQLLNAISKGSGYDIACASAKNPIFFQKKDSANTIEQALFQPAFHEQLTFVYLGNKQSTEKMISKFIDDEIKYTSEIQDISSITEEICRITELKEFVYLIEQHEKIIAGVTKEEPVKNRLFKDFPGSVKSLGTWGGDFILAVHQEPEENVFQYFQQKGYPIFFKYKDIVL